MKRILFLSLMLFPNAAHCELYLNDYLTCRNSAACNVYVQAVGEAYLYANAELELRGNAPLYCQPRKLTLTDDNYKRILDDQVDLFVKSGKPRKEIDLPVPVLLLMGLKNVFPCSMTVK